LTDIIKVMHIQCYHDALKWLKILGGIDEAITTSCSKMALLLSEVILEGRWIELSLIQRNCMRGRKHAIHVFS
jgi:phosphoserine aminotransferase